jgi:hypothetical protein
MTTKNPEAALASLTTLAAAQAEISAAQAVITRARSLSSKQAATARKTGASWAEIGAQCQPAIGATAARWRYAGDADAAAKRAADSRLRSKARTALIAEARVAA